MLKCLPFGQIVKHVQAYLKLCTHFGDLLNLGPKHADLCKDFFT